MNRIRLFYLKKCVGCGNYPELIMSSAGSDIGCLKCNLWTGVKKTQDEAETLWNELNSIPEDRSYWYHMVKQNSRKRVFPPVELKYPCKICGMTPEHAEVYKQDRCIIVCSRCGNSVIGKDLQTVVRSWDLSNMSWTSLVYVRGHWEMKDPQGKCIVSGDSRWECQQEYDNMVDYEGFEAEEEK